MNFSQSLLYAFSSLYLEASYSLSIFIAFISFIVQHLSLVGNILLQIINKNRMNNNNNEYGNMMIGEVKWNEMLEVLRWKDGNDE